MARNYSLLAQNPPVSLLPAAADAGGRTSRYASIRNCDKAYVIAHINQGNLTGVSLTLSQAQDTAGTNAKAIAAVPIWLNDSTASSDGFVKQNVGSNFLTDTALADKIVIFEITPEVSLDMANGFRTVAIQTGASNVANITEAKLILGLVLQGANFATTFS